MILLTGAAGKTGLAILEALQKSSEPVRAFVRRSSQAEEAERAGAAETLVGDFLATEDLRTACRDIRAVYHLCPNVHPQEVSIGEAVLAAARESKVEHFVYHSVLHPQTKAMPHHWRKLRVEEKILASGLPFTILQPTAYMQNLLAHRTSITEDGVLSLPYPPETRISLVDLGDLAEVAVRALTEPGHQGATYELCGTEPLSQLQVAATLAAALGRTVRCQEVALEDWEKGARRGGVHEESTEALLAMFRYYREHGLHGNPRVLELLLGRAPTSIESFVRRHFS